MRSQSWVVLHYKEKQPQQHKQVLTVNTGENTPPSSSRWREKDILGDTPEHSVLNHVCPPEKQVPRVSSAAVYQRLPGLGEREYPTPASDSLPCGEEKDLPQTSLCHSDPLKRTNEPASDSPSPGTRCSRSRDCNSQGCLSNRTTCESTLESSLSDWFNQYWVAQQRLSLSRERLAS